MKTIKDVKRCQQWCRRLRWPVVLVPTMGALHEGHLSLVRKATKYGKNVVVSIFVNPTQFGNNEDLDKYPRNLKKDLALLKKEKVTAVFVPDVKQVYGEDLADQTTILADKYLGSKLCGASRPGHFDGVVTIVAKLFNIINPDIAIFGQKDYQQFLIIKKLVADLNFPTKVLMSEIVREEDGLAMSSRNQYLSDVQRMQSLIIYKTLALAKILFREEKNVGAVKQLLLKHLRRVPEIRLDYLSILDAKNLLEIEKYQKKSTLVAIAVFVGKTRLIDNVII